MQHVDKEGKAMAHRAALDAPSSCVQASVCGTTVEHNSTAMETQSEPSGSGLAVGITSASEMRMFRKILSSNCIIKSQQRGEPDLTEKQKTDILVDCCLLTYGFKSTNHISQSRIFWWV